MRLVTKAVGKRRGGIVALVLVATLTGAKASPWAEPGDAQLRSDIEILANAGVIDGITTQWPLPWPGLLKRLAAAGALGDQPSYVVAAANRVMNEGIAETRTDVFRAQATFDATNDPSFVRGFADTGRESVQAQFSGEMIFSSSALRLNIGAQSSNTFKPLPEPTTSPTFDHRSGYITSGYFLDDRPDHQTLVFDGSYFAQGIGDSVVYAGYLPHWWGPGWISTMMMSTNARPFPQVGMSRLSTTASTLPVLSWLGPWQAEFVAGVLDGPGVTNNIVTDSLRVAFNPLPGLEVGLSRTQLLCGTDHPCKPLVTFFQIDHNATYSDNANSAGQMDIRYDHTIGGIPFSFYAQDMFMDSGFIDFEANSNVFGTSAWIPVGANTVRLTAEFASSVPTVDLLSFFSGSASYHHGFAYNSVKYPEGYRYRGSSLGFSLDSDSRLFTLQASYNDSYNRVYTFTLDRAQVSSSCNVSGCAFAGVYGNVVTTSGVMIDMAEGRVTLPLRNMKLDIAVRVQDDQPRPEHGWTAGLEVTLKQKL